MVDTQEEMFDRILDIAVILSYQLTYAVILIAILLIIMAFCIELMNLAYVFNRNIGNSSINNGNMGTAHAGPNINVNTSDNSEVFRDVLIIRRGRLAH